MDLKTLAGTCLHPTIKQMGFQFKWDKTYAASPDKNWKIRISLTKWQYYEADQINGTLTIEWDHVAESKIRFAFDIITPFGSFSGITGDNLGDVPVNYGSETYVLSTLMPDIFPITVVEEAGMDGEYFFIARILDENYALLAEDVATFYIIHDASRLKGLVKWVKFHNLERPIINDFNTLSLAPRDNLAFMLALIFGAQSGIIDGLNLSLDDGKVMINPGIAVQYLDEKYISEDGLLGSYPVVVRSKFSIGGLADHPANAAGETVINRYDPILIRTFFEDGGDTATSDTGERHFRTEDGRIIKQNVATTTRNAYQVIWDSKNRFMEGEQPKIRTGWMCIGFVRVKDGAAELTTEDLISYPYDPLILSQHRNKETLDHPARSVYPPHLSDNMRGEYKGNPDDLNLKEMSEEIKSARGTLPDMNERISEIIDTDGNVVYSKVEEAIRASILDILHRIIDDQGNLKASAIKGLQDEYGDIVVTHSDSVGGTMRGGILDGSDCPSLPVPEGFDVDECIPIAGPEKVEWDVDSTVIKVGFIVTTERGTLKVYGYKWTKYNNGTDDLIEPITVNFLVSAKKNIT